MIAPFRSIARVACVALLLLTAMVGAAGCAQPPADPQPGQVFASLHITGGIAARDVTITVNGDGVVQRTGAAARTLPNGGAGAKELYSGLVATGIFNVQPGSYLPANICCDRQTYELTLSRAGTRMLYVTMDGTETAPAPIMQALSLLQQSADAAK